MLRRSSGPHLAIQDAGELVRIEVENLESVGNVRESLETWGRGVWTAVKVKVDFSGFKT